VNDVLEAVDRGDLALTALERPTSDDDLVVLADGDRANLRVTKYIRDGCALKVMN